MKNWTRRYQAGIDLGSNQLSCWLGHSGDDQGLTLLGSSQVASRGLWGGQITDVRALEESIIRILYDTEQQARSQVRHASVALNGSFFKFERCMLKAPLPHGIVTDDDVQQMIAQLRHPDYHCTQVIPLEFWVDQQERIRDPRGMVGQQMAGHFHGIWINKGRFQTLVSCLKRCQVQIHSILFSGYASALSCLSPDERTLGTMLIDWGSSTTSASIFLNDLFIDQATLPIGGHDITQDIARGFGTSIAQAERLKILHGAALLTQNDHYETVSTEEKSDWDGDLANNFPRSALIRIIQNRCEEVLVGLKKHMATCPYAPSIQRIVLTGGGGQLPGLRELVQRFLNRSVRLAKPLTPKNAPRISTDLASVIGAMMHNGMPDDPLLSPTKKDFKFFSWLRKKM
jgi:cell division protein FtsA